MPTRAPWLTCRTPLAFVLAIAVSCFATVVAAQESATLHVPSGARRARRPPRAAAGAILDCANHGVWSPPSGWNGFELSRGITLAVSPSSGAALLRASLRSHVDRAAVSRVIDALVGAPVALPTRTHGRVDATVATVVGGETVDVRWIQRGDALWVSIATAREAASAPRVETARASFLMLVDHACACGYDCDRRVR